MPRAAQYFGLIPAAGSSARLGTEVPKQYRALADRPLLAYAIERLRLATPLRRTYVVLATADRRYASAIGRLDRVKPLRCGGTTRAESVRNGLALMRGEVHEQDWVLVHDAARPCLDRASLSRLLVEVGDDAVGGLLAVPVADTLKREGAAGPAACERAGVPRPPPGVDRFARDQAKRVTATLAREGLWQAQTPQMFRYGVLLDALARPGAETCTDEAQAVEALGLAPRLVPGSSTNIKVTWPADLVLAAAILELQRAHPE